MLWNGLMANRQPAICSYMPYRHHLPIGCQEGMTRQASTIPTTDSMAEAKVAMIRTTIMVMEIMGSMVATMISKTGTRKTGGAEIPMLAPLIKTKPPLGRGDLISFLFLNSAFGKHAFLEGCG